MDQSKTEYVHRRANHKPENRGRVFGFPKLNTQDSKKHISLLTFISKLKLYISVNTHWELRESSVKSGSETRDTYTHRMKDDKKLYGRKRYIY